MVTLLISALFVSSYPAIDELEPAWRAAMSVADEDQVAEIVRQAENIISSRMALDVPREKRPEVLAATLKRIKDSRSPPEKAPPATIVTSGYVRIDPDKGTTIEARTVSSRGLNFQWRNIENRHLLTKGAISNLASGIFSIRWTAVPSALQIKDSSIVVFADVSQIEILEPISNISHKFDIASMGLQFHRPRRSTLSDMVAWRAFLAGRKSTLDVPERAVRVLTPSILDASNEFETRRAEKEAVDAINIARAEKPEPFSASYRAYSIGAEYDFDREGFVLTGPMPSVSGLEITAGDDVEFFLPMEPAFAERHGRWRLHENDALLISVSGTKKLERSGSERRTDQLKKAKSRLERFTLESEPLPPALLELKAVTMSIETVDGLPLGAVKISKKKPKKGR